MINRRLLIKSSLVSESVDQIKEYMELYDNKKTRQRLYFLMQVKEGFINNDNVDTIAGIMGIKVSTIKNWFREYLTHGIDYFISKDTNKIEKDIVMDGAIRMRHVKEGKACAACGIYFNSTYGRPTVCKSCVDWYNYGKRKFPEGAAIADE